jgi:exodeoxyribonuclease VII small subunit
MGLYGAHGYTETETRFSHIIYSAGLRVMKKKSFEEALAKLEQITNELEDGDLSLEESLKYFDEGVKLAEQCSSKLSEAQKKVEILLKKNNRLEPVPFDELDEKKP